MRDTFSNEHSVASIAERWLTVDNYFECVTECDLEDQVCITKCMVAHLSGDEEGAIKTL